MIGKWVALKGRAMMIFLVWIGLCVAVGIWAASWGRSAISYFIMSILLAALKLLQEPKEEKKPIVKTREEKMQILKNIVLLSLLVLATVVAFIIVAAVTG